MQEGLLITGNGTGVGNCSTPRVWGQTARLKSVDDLDLLMNVLESNRAFFVKNDRLAAEVLTLV